MPENGISLLAPGRPPGQFTSGPAPAQHFLPLSHMLRTTNLHQICIQGTSHLPGDGAVKFEQKLANHEHVKKTTEAAGNTSMSRFAETVHFCTNRRKK